jgi:prevent-host-death family protein
VRKHTDPAGRRPTPVCLDAEAAAGYLDSLDRTVRMTWQLQDAKNRFSEVVDDALHKGPQLVTRRGEPVVMVVALETWRRATAPKQSLFEFLRSNTFDDELDLTRDTTDRAHPFEP